jgi:hypothetical protein
MRCPVCKAENVSGPNCRRCKADLTLLFALEDRRAWALAAARQALRGGKWREATTFAEEANKLRADEESRKLLAGVWLLRREFARAFRVALDSRDIEKAAID